MIMKTRDRIFLTSFLATSMLIGLPTQAQAQNSAQTGTANPARVQEQFSERDFEPRISPQVEVKELRLEGAPENADEITFELRQISFDGVTIYEHEELQKVYEDKLGQTISLSDLYGIAEDLTKKYRNEGYILTRVVVPPQTIDAGLVQLRVVEGYVDNIEIRTDKESSADLIREYTNYLKGPLRSRNLERVLLLINDLPGINARSVLSPSKTKTGAADLLIIVERDRFDADIGINNFGTRFLGPVQTSASASANSIFGFNERLTAQVVVAWDNEEELKELEYGALRYEQPIGKYGTRLIVSGNAASTEPGYTLDELGVKGHTKGYTVAVSHPFVRSRTFNVNTQVSFDYLNLNSKDGLGNPVVEDNIRALRLGGRVEYMDQFLGLSFNTLDLTLSRGIDVFGATKGSDVNVTRPDADPKFLKLEVELQRLHKISNSVNLLIAGRGQLSNAPLLSSEEFGFGGINYGRGYDSSEILGDEGMAGKVEIQWQEPREISFLDSYQLYGFYDAGRIWNDDPGISLDLKKETLTSAGFGMRANVTDQLTADLLLGFPINKTPQTKDDKEPRVLFSLNKRF